MMLTRFTKKLKVILFLGIWLLGTSVCFAQIKEVKNNSWKEITPLISTRQDVEKILGKPIEDDIYSAVYKTKDERVIVSYKVLETKKTKSCVWDVPINTVLGFRIYPLKIVLLSETKFDLTKFERESWGYEAFYTNPKEGLEVVTNAVPGEKEQVLYFWYSATLSDRQRKCKISKK